MKPTMISSAAAPATRAFAAAITQHATVNAAAPRQTAATVPKDPAGLRIVVARLVFDIVFVTLKSTG